MPAPAFALALLLASDVRISGVHFDGLLPGSPEPDSAVRLTNTDAAHVVDVSGWQLTERFTPTRKKAELTRTTSGEGLSDESARTDDDDGTTKKSRKATGTVRFPEGTKIPPGGEIWIAASAEGFRKIFGVSPALEAAQSSPSVPDLEGGAVFLRLPDPRGTVALVDTGGTVVDFVAYENTKDAFFTDEDFNDLPWKGPPVRLVRASFYGWRGQVLARDRDEQGRLLPDTNTESDWDAGFSEKQLGEEPTHRVEIAGQSRFVSQPLRGVRARVLATSAPDNNFKALVDALNAAKKSIRVRIYEMTNPKIVEALIGAKKRGLDVRIYLEGAPVGGIADQERWLLDRAHKAGIPIWFLGTTKGSSLKPRYRFDHSKYVLIDGTKAIVGSENYGRTGVPVDPSFGNRGWMVHIEQPDFVAQLQAVWDADLRPGELGDIIDIDASANDSYGMPYRDPAFVPDESVHRGRYAPAVKPILVDDKMNLELVLSPDTSLNENSAIIGLIQRANRTLFVEQNSIRRRWGSKNDDNDTFGGVPNLALQAVIAAARRGVQVRVLLDSTWYNVQGDEDRDNDNTAVFLNDLAAREGLDLVAKVINLETAQLQKIHTKGVIVDDREVFVGSINWTENSFKGNREVGVVVSHAKVAGYYSKLFRRDWAASRVFSAPVVDKSTVHAARDDRSNVLLRLARGDLVTVVGEHHVKDRTGTPRTWLEVALPSGAETGFLDASRIGTPIATAGEALHVIGRDAVITGRVVATNVNEKRIQLRLADEARPPFTAVIFARDIDKFAKAGLPPSSAYQGKEVRIHGPVRFYRTPEVILNDPSQIEIVRQEAGGSPRIR